MTSPNTLNVLVADDDPTLRNLIATLLRRRGYKTTEAVDGEDAIAILQSETSENGSSNFDLVVLDLMMPRKSGWDVLDFIDSEMQCLQGHVLVISAAGEDRLSDLEGRSCGVMPKPFGASDFYGSVERHMRHA
ncbi:MAG TPA: response regulator [Thermoanaerobaculia bacterium]|nr:response regulator [Thermoanaerobaculia bacterium]